MIKAVIFDIGGVIIGEKISAVKILAEAFEMSSEEIKPIAGSILGKMSTGEISESEGWTMLSEQLGKSIPENFEEIWDRETKSGSELLPGALEMVRAVKDKGKLALVLSNTIPPYTRRNKPAGLYKDFDRVYLSWEIGFRKPDKRAYLYLLDKENLKGEECLIADDKKENLETAKMLGMKTVWAQSPKQVVNEVEDLLFKK